MRVSFNKRLPLSKFVFCLMGLGAALPCMGDLLLFQNGPSIGGEDFAEPGNPIPGINGYAVEWQQSTGYTNMTVSAEVYSQTSAQTVDAWITDLAGNILYSDLNVTINANTDSLHTFFSGISLCGCTYAGNYYFILATPDANSGLAGWDVQSGTGGTAAPGVSYQGSFETFGASLTNPWNNPDATSIGSSEAFIFQVTGVPEPSTLWLIGPLALAFAFVARRKRLA